MFPKLSKKFYTFFGIVLSVLILDQLTKRLFDSFYEVGNGFNILPFLSFTLRHNTGAGFSLFEGKTAFLIVFSIIVIAVILINYKNIPKDISLPSLALILGGSIGNLIDRLFHGYVIDFIELSFWPTFNVADSAITIGGILIIYYIFRKEKK